jgi:hypothetical protein
VREILFPFCRAAVIVPCLYLSRRRKHGIPRDTRFLVGQFGREARSGRPTPCCLWMAKTRRGHTVTTSGSLSFFMGLRMARHNLSWFNLNVRTQQLCDRLLVARRVRQQNGDYSRFWPLPLFRVAPPLLFGLLVWRVDKCIQWNCGIFPRIWFLSRCVQKF